MAKTKELEVLIIGAGSTGLLLAQGLKKVRRDRRDWRIVAR